VKLGVLTLQNAPWPEPVERWRRLDELGVQTIWVADHLADWMHIEQAWFEAWSCITALAHRTVKPRIGPLVSSMTLRNPAVLARTALTVAELSGGRLELGVGSGGPAHDHELAQVPKWKPRERAALFAGWVERLPAGDRDAGRHCGSGRLRACLRREGLGPPPSKSRPWRARSVPARYVRSLLLACARGRAAAAPAGTSILS
jgi:alkanesulfonate monooxygenase SsuD/methylene tetrahydromethanopterin reductase-like flavin-dependent oxidoreductase (luciferase family)